MTAMNEMLQWVRATLPMDLDWPRMIEDKIESLIKKEKQQIIKSWEKGYCTGCVVGSNDYTNEDEKKDNGNYYYNQNYNQNK
jgi:hypothetical protein